MWHLVDVVLPDVSQKRIASIFKVEGKIRNISLLAATVTGSSLADFLIFPSTLKMNVIRFSETSVNTTYTRRHILEDCFLHLWICL
jgi:hypothetical protein